MAALTAPRMTPQADPIHAVPGYSSPTGYDVAANVTIYPGAIVMKNAAGDATPGAAATGQIALGRAETLVTNGATPGAVKISVRHGVFQYENSSAGDAITKADIGADCFIVDDQTVAKTNGSSTRSRCGKIMAVDAQGVWVLIFPGL